MPSNFQRKPECEKDSGFFDASVNADWQTEVSWQFLDRQMVFGDRSEMSISQSASEDPCVGDMLIIRVLCLKLCSPLSGVRQAVTMPTIDLHGVHLMFA